MAKKRYGTKASEKSLRCHSVKSIPRHQSVQPISVTKMNPTVLLALFLAVAAAAPGNVIQVDLNDQNHSQSGDAGNSVSGQYSFTDGDGVTHTIRYIADDKGYRVIGRDSVGGVATVTPKPIPKPAVKPVAVPVPIPAPAPKPVAVPVPIPAPAPKPVAVPVPIPAPAPAPLPAPIISQTTSGILDNNVYYILGGSSGFHGSYGHFPGFISGSHGFHGFHGSGSPIILVKECACNKN